ncbi:hypothetical protein HWV62_5004 [Athelia sp. TMB]|nr:hypothetical protein HWV62_5004 [Athelia sp. TMB]
MIEDYSLTHPTPQSSGPNYAQNMFNNSPSHISDLTLSYKEAHCQSSPPVLPNVWHPDDSTRSEYSVGLFSSLYPTDMLRLHPAMGQTNVPYFSTAEHPHNKDSLQLAVEEADRSPFALPEDGSRLYSGADYAISSFGISSRDPGTSYVSQRSSRSESKPSREFFGSRNHDGGSISVASKPPAARKKQDNSRDGEPSRKRCRTSEYDYAAPLSKRKKPGDFEHACEESSPVVMLKEQWRQKTTLKPTQNDEVLPVASAPPQPAPNPPAQSSSQTLHGKYYISPTTGEHVPLVDGACPVCDRTWLLTKENERDNSKRTHIKPRKSLQPPRPANPFVLFRKHICASHHGGNKIAGMSGIMGRGHCFR